MGRRVCDLRAQVVHSAGAGLFTASAVNGDLIAEDTRLAVEIHRSRTTVPTAS